MTVISTLRKALLVAFIPQMVCGHIIRNIRIVRQADRTFSRLISSHDHLTSSCLFPSRVISSHLTSPHLLSFHPIPSRLVSAHLISSCLVSSHHFPSHLISSSLIWCRFWACGSKRIVSMGLVWCRFWACGLKCIAQGVCSGAGFGRGACHAL